MSASKPSPMVLAAARELCRQHAEVCEVHKDDAWNLYEKDFIADAQKVLDACGAPELLEALQQCAEALRHGDFSNGVTDSTGTIDEGNVRVSELARRVETLVAKATGSAP